MCDRIGTGQAWVIWHITDRYSIRGITLTDTAWAATVHTSDISV